MKNPGFTLLEVLISVTILTTLIVFSSQAIRNGLKAKAKIQDQVEDASAVRDALWIMTKDINLAMHYRDIEAELKQSIQTTVNNSQGNKPTTTSPPPLGSPPPGGNSTPEAEDAIKKEQARQALQQALNQWVAVDSKRVNPTTDFIGSEEEIHFVTMNAPRLSESVPQADFIKVGYYLADCKKAGDTGRGSKCLLRSSSPLVEGNIEVNGPSSILLENVTEFKLRYIASSKQDWITSWNSKSGDPSIKDHFPETVEISLAIAKGEGTKKKTLSMQMIAPIRFPNNPPKQNGITSQFLGFPSGEGSQEGTP